MSKSRSQIMSKLNDLYDWLIGHVPRTIKDGASRAFKTFKDNIMGFCTGSQTNEGLKPLKGPRSAEDHLSHWSNLLKVLTDAIESMEDLEWM